MSDVVIASNTSTKVNRAIGGATTVNANCYAVVTYAKADVINISSTGPEYYGVNDFGSITRWFGPGQSIPNSFNFQVSNSYLGNAGVSYTFVLMSGVEFINSP